MGDFINRVIPHVGIKIDASPLFHFARDLLVTLLLWLIGFRDFHEISGSEKAISRSFRSQGEHSVTTRYLACYLSMSYIRRSRISGDVATTRLPRGVGHRHHADVGRTSTHT